jgi:DNA-binding transcriptional MerR regulator/methylmalonyl-CoA mutase cobalamin-binding subunit
MTFNGDLLGIGLVERESGLSKDTLRIWERRYGFPNPTRDAHGERVYPLDQVEKLLLMKRLMDRGERPGKMAGLSAEILREKLEAVHPEERPASELDDVVQILSRRDLPLLRQHLSHKLARQGLHAFVVETVAPLTIAVGEAWNRGRLAIHDEHVYTEVISTTLRQATAGLGQQTGAPCVILATLPDEMHGIGLLMVEALLSIEGATCISLGIQTPGQEIARAAAGHNADIAALSFSSSYPVRQAEQAVNALRRLIPETIEVWCGGTTGANLKLVDPGIRMLESFDRMIDCLKAWRARHSPNAPAN